MLEELLTYLNNWFAVCRYRGVISMDNGRLVAPIAFINKWVQPGDYFRIRGSGRNDGFYQQPIGDEGLEEDKIQTDEAAEEIETFPALVEALLIPAQLVQLAKEMEEWRAKNGAASAGPYTSESFGGYNYTKAARSDGSIWSVYDAFADRLAPYKRMNFARDGDAGGHAHHDPDYRRPFNTDFR